MDAEQLKALVDRVALELAARAHEGGAAASRSERDWRAAMVPWDAAAAVGAASDQLGSAEGYGYQRVNETDPPETDPYSIGSIYRRHVLDDVERSRTSEQHMQKDEKRPSVFDFDSEDFDGLAALKAMRLEMQQAYAKLAIANEDTRRFLEARHLIPK